MLHGKLTVTETAGIAIEMHPGITVAAVHALMTAEEELPGITTGVVPVPVPVPAETVDPVEILQIQEEVDLMVLLDPVGMTVQDFNDRLIFTFYVYLIFVILM
jgi:hypothetical protein